MKRQKIWILPLLYIGSLFFTCCGLNASDLENDKRRDSGSQFIPSPGNSSAGSDGAVVISRTPSSSLADDHMSGGVQSDIRGVPASSQRADDRLARLDALMDKKDAVRREYYGWGVKEFNAKPA